MGKNVRGKAYFECSKYACIVHRLLYNEMKTKRAKMLVAYFATEYGHFFTICNL